MTTRNMVRCRKCSKCRIDDGGNMLCTEYCDESGRTMERNVDDIRDDDCPLEQEY